MAIQDMDMDICLNITTEPVIPQKKVDIGYVSLGI